MVLQHVGVVGIGIFQCFVDITVQNGRSNLCVELVTAGPGGAVRTLPVNCFDILLHFIHPQRLFSAILQCRRLGRDFFGECASSLNVPVVSQKLRNKLLEEGRLI